MVQQVSQGGAGQPIAVQPPAKPVVKPVQPVTKPQGGARPVAQPVQGQPATAQPNMQTEESSPWYTKWWVWTIAAAVIIAIAVGIWIFMS